MPPAITDTAAAFRAAAFIAVAASANSGQYERMDRNKETSPIPISGLAHIGIRVHDLERSVRFYELLGFTKTAGPIGPEPVAILDHPSGVEVNLVLNAPNASEPNILMDVAEKHPGITHFALLCPDIIAAKAAARGGRHPAERRAGPLRTRRAGDLRARSRSQRDRAAPARLKFSGVGANAVTRGAETRSPRVAAPPRPR